MAKKQPQLSANGYPARPKAVLYARVSSKDQEQEGYSIPAQLKLLKEYAQKESFEVAREFIDVETAKQSGRTNFNEMVQYLEEHPKVGTILCEKTDRLYRNFKDYVIIDDLDLKLAGCGLAIWRQVPRKVQRFVPRVRE